MTWLSALGALLPILGKLLDLFIKTDTEKVAAVQKALLEYVEDINAGLKQAKETKGDTSYLERTLNRRRH